MIYVDYSYLRKSDGKTCSATKEFDTVNKAVRFIYLIVKKPNYSYDGFSCDDEEETYEMNRRI